MFGTDGDREVIGVAGTERGTRVPVVAHLGNDGVSAGHKAEQSRSRE